MRALGLSEAGPDQAVAPEEDYGPFAPDTLAGLTVLLVEDDPSSREALEGLLEAHGAHVVSVPSALEGLIAYERHQPALLVSDIGLEGADGCALMRAIRMRERNVPRHLPAVAISGALSRYAGIRARGAGFDEFLAKPLNIRSLLDTVTRLTGRDGAE